MVHYTVNALGVLPPYMLRQHNTSYGDTAGA